ncbi:MAG TPA: DUF6600 domain-containing protein [Polyangiaceae bacterium]
MPPRISFSALAVGATILALAGGCVRKAYVPPAAPLPPGPPIVLRETEETAPADAYGDTDPSALTAFSDTLNGHGTWLDDDDYGTVWAPDPGDVGTGFAPYVSAGHWAYDDVEGYVWVSDYPWGWVTFHYGRWILTAGHGWVWIPGRAYAGAWVIWRIGDDDFDYVGWAPEPPIWIWQAGIAVSLGFVPPTAYVFCGRGEVFASDVGVRVVRGDTAWMEKRTRPFGPAWAGDEQRPFEPRRVTGPRPETLHVTRDRVPAPPAPVSHAVRSVPPGPVPSRGVTAPQPPSLPLRHIAPASAPARRPKPPPAPAPAPKKVSPKRYRPAIPPPGAPVRPKVQ